MLNGHPTIAPAPNNNVADIVLISVDPGRLLLAGERANEKATMLQYMAKVEGKKAVDALHIPVLVKSMKKK